MVPSYVPLVEDGPCKQKHLNVIDEFDHRRKFLGIVDYINLKCRKSMTHFVFFQVFTSWISKLNLDNSSNICLYLASCLSVLTAQRR